MKKVLCGNDMDKMPNWSFKIMAFMFNVADVLKSPDRRLDGFGIRKGQTVVDWGCGTGRYLKQASELAGSTGTVYAVDIQPLGVEAAVKRAKKHQLDNVHALQTDGKSVAIPDHTVDLIYALDMFHMVGDTKSFLKELHRIAKNDAVLFLEDGHQPRTLAKQKITNSGCWEITAETKGYVKCKPKCNP